MLQRPRYKRVLSIDGGGIRGIIPACILIALENRLQERTNNPDARLSDFFDLIAGTSTGGIMTCCLLVTDPATNRPQFRAQEVLDIWYGEGAEIFNRGRVWPLLSGFGFFDSKYSSANLDAIITRHVGDLRLSQLAKPCVVTSFDLNQSRAFFFKQHRAQDLPDLNGGFQISEENFTVRDVALSTSAAPSFFPPHQASSLRPHPEPRTLIDGGVVCNNPALCGLVEAMTLFNCAPHDVVLLSLGTGMQRQVAHDYPHRWSVFSWIVPLVNIIKAGGSATVVDHQLAAIFTNQHQNQYLRIQPNLDDDNFQHRPSWKLDDASQENRDALWEAGLFTANQFGEQLDRFVDLLISQREN